MATVYLAHDVKHDRDVAVKVLRPDVASEVGAERFLREIKLAAKLSHPHILPLHDSGDADGFLYYVMPNVEGSSVRDRLRNETQFAVDEAVRITREVADALDYAHRHGVVHRDVKPDNIMLHDGHAMVADFGIGKAVSGTEGGDTLTHTGVTVGTPAYMSPEQASGEAELDGRSDLYSLGCVLYEMLTGEPPFTGATAQAVIAKRFVQIPLEVTVLRAGVPTPVSQVVAKALAKAPVDRFATGSALGQALELGVTPVDTDVETGPSQKSIAVLPFASMSADPENEFFADGITEEIINVLAQLPELEVASRTSSFYFKGKSSKVPEVAQELGVANILEGSVRKAGNRVRITAQLVDVRKDTHVWSERYDREMEDVFAIQDDIARAIADRLKLTLGGATGGALVKPATENVEAYQLYLKGRALLYQRGPSIPAGRDCLEEALRLDPEYALAHAGLADALVMLGYYGFVPPGETMPQAKEAASRAAELAPDLAETHSALAGVALLYDWDWATAEHEFLQALQLNPRYTQARGWYALFYLQFVADRIDEGLAEGKRGAELDPLSSYAASLHAVALLIANRPAEAMAEARRAMDLDPTSFLSRWVLQLTYDGNGQLAEAVAAAEDALAISGRGVWALAHLGSTYAKWGKGAEATAVHEEMVARSAHAHIQPSMLALSAAAAGKMDEAVSHAQRGYEERDPFLMVLARIWPHYDRLRADSRFKKIIEQIGYP